MTKVKVGLFINNNGIKDVELSSPEKGNPGIGGTHYLFIAITYFLQKLFSHIIEPVLFAPSIKRLPDDINAIEAKSCIEAVSQASEIGCDIFIWWPQYPRFKNLLKSLNKTNLKAIAWSHNYLYPSVLHGLNKCENVKRVVAVSREQLDSMRDHPVIRKGTFIYNPVHQQVDKKVEKDSHSVTYMGSIVPMNRFHVLASIWPKIRKNVLDAKLHVIGTGKVYSRGNELGKWGIAAESYEQRWRKYLSDKDGNPDESVVFHGNLGEEKWDIMRRSQVGVADPMGIGTFCLVATEFQSVGTPVVAGKRGGLLDTVADGESGYLCANKNQLAERITYLLIHPDTALQMGKNGKDHIKKFNYYLISVQWIKLLLDVVNDVEPILPEVKSNIWHNKKILREVIRLARNNFTLLSDMPSITEFRDYIPGVTKAPK
ncbi:MAG TPA: glycosyltransferase family 4 protein [Balneolaceae bacterium]|nr:glycosyltransferase family 4 protein [Balneolaceae bacterium]